MDPSEGLRKAINISIKDYDLDHLMKYFSSASDTRTEFNATTLSRLFAILRKDGNYEDKVMHMKCVLACMKHFLEIKLSYQEWEHVAEDVCRLCVLIFVMSDVFIKNDSLILEIIHVTHSVILLSNKIANNLLRCMLEPLLNMQFSFLYSIETRLSVLGFAGSLLEKSSRQTRNEIVPTIFGCLQKLSNYLFHCGDYETQVMVVEIIARCKISIKESDSDLNLFSEFPAILQIFNKYSFLNFDSECRLFLNEANEGMGDKQLVFSVPSVAIYAGNTQLKKPVDPTNSEFWVDFNINSKSVSFYYLDIITDSMELMSINEDSIFVVVCKNSCYESANGILIDTVKMEITWRNSVNLDLPNILKIYFYKSRSFVKAEDSAIKKIFKNKYSSEVLYKNEEFSLLPFEQSIDCKETINKSNSDAINHMTTVEKSIVKEPPLTELEKKITYSDSFSQYIEQRMAEKYGKTPGMIVEVSKKRKTNNIGAESEIHKMLLKEDNTLKMCEDVPIENNKFENSASSNNNIKESTECLAMNEIFVAPKIMKHSTSKLASPVFFSFNTSQSSKVNENVTELQKNIDCLKKRHYFSSSYSEKGEKSSHQFSELESHDYHYFISDKKPLVLNKTRGISKESNQVSPKTLYSSLSSVQKNKPVRKPRIRLNQKNKCRKMFQMLLSDSDSDTEKKLPIQFKTRKCKGKNKSSKKHQVQNNKEWVNKHVEDLTRESSVCNKDFELPKFESILSDNNLAMENLNHPLPQDISLEQITLKLNEIMQFGKLCLSQTNNEFQRIKSPALKEKEMHFAEFHVKVQSSCSTMFKHFHTLEIVSKNLLKVKRLLDTTYNLQKDIALQFKTEITLLEEAKQTLITNINKIEQSESSQIASMFQKMVGYIKNILFSFIKKIENTNQSKLLNI